MYILFFISVYFNIVSTCTIESCFQTAASTQDFNEEQKNFLNNLSSKEDFEELRSNITVMDDKFCEKIIPNLSKPMMVDILRAFITQGSKKNYCFY